MIRTDHQHDAVQPIGLWEWPPTETPQTKADTMAQLCRAVSVVAPVLAFFGMVGLIWTVLCIVASKKKQQQKQQQQDNRTQQDSLLLLNSQLTAIAVLLIGASVAQLCTLLLLDSRLCLSNRSVTYDCRHERGAIISMAATVLLVVSCVAAVVALCRQDECQYDDDDDSDDGWTMTQELDFDKDIESDEHHQDTSVEDEDVDSSVEHEKRQDGTDDGGRPNAKDSVV